MLFDIWRTNNENRLWADQVKTASVRLYLLDMAWHKALGDREHVPIVKFTANGS